MASVAQYGGFVHRDNEANLVRYDVRTRLSPRGRRLQRIQTVYLAGELQETGQALINQANALTTGYLNDYGDFRYTVNGIVTPHGLTNGNTVSGVRVIHRSWPNGDAAELATKRKFSVVLQGIYDDCEDQIVYWTENLHYIGNCGPSFMIIDTYNGPYAIQTASSTAQRIIQYGSSVGYSANALPYGSLFPQNEHQNLREIDVGGGIQQGQGARFFRTTWKYVHTFGAPQEALPITL